MTKKNYEVMTVYKASAGSGKTFTLAVRFIELLIQNPEAYKQTLAVTFTNKATEEMKHRILSQLFGISRHLPDSSSYLERICNDLGMEEEYVCKQAEKALMLILHDYNNFNIETIDAFFQKVLRNLAREMNLNANLRVELNDIEIEEKAVDQLIADLTEDDRILTWILGYINEQMEDEKGWNVIESIKKFGKKIFSDDYKKYAEELQEKFDESKNPGFFSEYYKMMKSTISDADKEMKDYAGKFFKAIEDAGYEEGEFKANTWGFFKKLQLGDYSSDKVWNKTAQGCSDSAEGWFRRGVKSTSPLYQFAESTLVPLIKEANARREKVVKDVVTAKAILRNLNELRLLSHIKEMVNAMNAEDNRFLLSDTQNMLNRMMIDTDAPFIFEKIGGPLENIMIDEFQDTSTIQWQNFSTLLHECISKEESKNLIVGDVKQSIYRWRNGDWKLLSNGLKEDVHITNYGYEEIPLDANYRSEGNVINFNNWFFIKGAVEEAKMIEDNPQSHILPDIYNKDDVFQNVPKKEKNNGLVDILLLGKGSKDDEESVDFFHQVMDIVNDQLKTLFDLGVKDEDICILARNNGELTRMAEYLQDMFKEHTFVSDEAFKLDASFAVNIIITAIRVLNHPNDKLAKAQLAKLYQEKVVGNTISEVFFREDSEIDKYLPLDFVANRGMLLTRPLTDLAEELFRVFGLQKFEGESAYVLAFYDQLNSFAQNNNPDLELLLDAWEESMHKNTVKGGSLTGVRLLTIHKSKGLEAEHVLIPFVDWKLDPFGSDLWCTTEVLPFGNMPVVPVNSFNIKNSHFDEQYYEEQLQIYIDNMNLLYVAFTRARKNLFVIGKRSKTTGNSHRSSLIQRTLPLLAEMPEFADAMLDYDEKDENKDIHFTFGSLFVKNKEKENSENVFEKDAASFEVKIRDLNNNLEFRQSNASRKFVEPADEENTALNNTSTGTILHNVLARIKSVAEIDKVLREFEQDGRLSTTDPELNRDNMAKLIRNRIENNKLEIINSWFSDEVDVFNECTLVGYDEESGMVKEFRPDRVVRRGDEITVIDYKFGTHKDSYIHQVKNYMNLLQQMGYSNVKGYLWYVYKNTIKEVK